MKSESFDQIASMISEPIETRFINKHIRDKIKVKNSQEFHPYGGNTSLGYVTPKRR